MPTPQEHTTDSSSLEQENISKLSSHAYLLSIVDYSFSASSLPSVNADTLKSAPPQAMQFGKALRRLLQAINYADPAHGYVYLIKVDIADGFYRVWVNPEDVPKLGVVFPTLKGQPELIAFPLALPMGWVESPPYFCMATETVTDLANDELWYMHRRPPLPHRLDETANTLPPDHRHHKPEARTSHPSSTQPIACCDVYIDDFIGACQGSHNHRINVRRLLLHQLDKVFRPLTPEDVARHRDEPASIKKLKTGDGAWTTKKVILGWQVDTVSKTLALPPHRYARLHEILDDLPRTKHRVSLRKWQQHIGELRSMALALPGSKGLFSLLQEAFRHRDNATRVRLSPAVHDSLDDFRWLLEDVRSRPTHLHELFPGFHYHLGACDASKSGMGGVWFPINPHHPPIVWRQPFQSFIQARLVSTDTPKGDITNSDLELAGTIAQLDIATTYLHTFHQTLSILSDNTPAIAWQGKGSTSTKSATAYLLRIQALHQRHHQYHATFDHIAGTANTMADTASRCFDLTDSALSTTTSWRLYHLSSAMTCALESALLCKRPKPESFLPLNDASKPCLADGSPSSPPLGPIPSRVPSLHYTSILPDGPNERAYLILAFLHHVRTGASAPRRLPDGSVRLSPVGSRTVEDALRAVAQACLMAGFPDPTRLLNGERDLRVRGALLGWAKNDPCAERAKPFPKQLLQHVCGITALNPDPLTECRRDMILIRFFYLLQPGEYNINPARRQSTPFRIMDVELWLHDTQLNLYTATDHDLLRATRCLLTFTNQKNGIRGEKTSHGPSGHPLISPPAALARRIIHLRAHAAPPTTPLANYYTSPLQCHKLHPAHITTHLRHVATLHGTDLGFSAKDVSTASLRSGGAMAMLAAGISKEQI
jgi:hypothetical protein